MLAKPTGSYEIELPDDVAESSDERVSSYWRQRTACALQLSSYVRERGDQVSAEERLAERIRQGGQWRRIQFDEKAHLDRQVAAAVTRDEEDCTWTHIYLVWPDLTVYATVSRPRDEPPTAEQWAIDALRSIRRV